MDSPAQGPGPRGAGPDGAREPEDVEAAPEASAPQTLPPRPLSTERLTSALRELGYHFFIDSEGDVGGIWLGRLFHFFLIGDSKQILQVRGRWNRRVTLERLTEVLQLCDRWNRELVWPKCYVRVQDDGFMHVVAETSAPFAAGATDEQLVTVIRNGLVYAAAIFDALDRHFPDPAEAAT